MSWDWLARYLSIPSDYCRHLGELRWAQSGRAVDYVKGGTFVFKDEIRLFLEGFASSRAVIHFGFVLHLMQLLSRGGPLKAQVMWQCFHDTGRSWHNAGAFAGHLCRDIPAVPDSNQWQPVSASLFAMLGVPVVKAETPPFEPGEFEKCILNALEEIPIPTIHHWLRHGRPPVEEPQEIVRQLEETQPRTLGHVMATMAQRKRLSGAVPFVAQLISALALPPRRLAEQELPLGGYVDVTTRGQPEHILPSQFAVDDLEFVRRFAQRELLYFRREEPHNQLKEELLILLDQGVRTWGEVRLVLSAAVFALARRAEARKTPFRLAVTCADGRVVDPLEIEDDELGTMLEASDLTLQPGMALERVLAEPAEAARDVVLLTHPRSLAEPEVSAAALRATGDTRLFALSVDEEGQARLDELRQGVPLPVRQFRIQPPSEPAPVREVFEPLHDPLPAFTGDVEPVGFPFRIGVTGPIQHLAFDYSGDWLLIGGAKGMLHAVHLPIGEVETWPRGYDGQNLLTQVDVLLGVAGGFVVGGRFGSKLVAMHYDLSSRTARLHRLPLSDSESWKWHYFLEQHCLVVRGGEAHAGIDLATGAHGNQRVKAACERSQGRWPAPWLYVGTRLTTMEPSLHVDTSGSLAIRGMPQVWKPFKPMTDGRPALVGRAVHQAQCNGTVLAVSSYPREQPNPQGKLHLFRGQRGQGIGELALRGDAGRFMLAPIGQRLAVQSGTARVVVYDLAGGLQPIWQSPVARCHSGMDVELGDRWLTVQVGKFVHFFRWDGGRLLHRQTRGNKDALIKEEIAGTPLYGTPARMQPAAAVYRQPSSEATYCWQRFSDMTSPRVGVDHQSQVAVLDDQRKVVCMFYVFRERWAAWLPDGTRLGPSTITGGPETPHAADRVGKALLAGMMEASERSS